MWPTVQHGDVEPCHKLQDVLAVRIARVVVHDHSIGSPLRILTVQLQHQLPQEDLHGPLVGVRLQQGKISLAKCVQAHKHGNPGLHGLLGHRIRCARNSPLHSTEITHP